MAPMRLDVRAFTAYRPCTNVLMTPTPVLTCTDDPVNHTLIEIKNREIKNFAVCLLFLREFQEFQTAASF
jgi:hypothetical protein